jgi:hypothetical protein
MLDTYMKKFLKEFKMSLLAKKIASRYIAKTAAKEETSWKDLAVDALCHQIGCTTDLLMKDSQGRCYKDGKYPNSIVVTLSQGAATNGESQWLVFETFGDAEVSALSYIQSKIEENPSAFDMNWLSQYFSISSSDVKRISQEDALEIVKELSPDEMIAELSATYSDEDSDIQEFIEDFLETQNELKTLTISTDDEISIKELELAFAQLKKEARELLIGNIASKIAQELTENPAGYWENLTGSLEDLPSWIQIDSKGAAQNAILSDGVGEFLDSHDGEEIYLRGTTSVAFGQAQEI